MSATLATSDPTFAPPAPTPADTSPTPPRWMVDKHPDMLAVPDPDSVIQLPWKPDVAWVAANCNWSRC